MHHEITKYFQQCPSCSFSFLDPEEKPLFSFPEPVFLLPPSVGVAGLVILEISFAVNEHLKKNRSGLLQSSRMVLSPSTVW
jgi:hypothetical protein